MIPALLNALLAVAQPSWPIQIQSCTVVQAFRNAGPYRYTWPGSAHVPYIDGLEISFVDTSDKTVDRVSFAVNYRGDKERIEDTGTFSPGITINHQFGQFTGDAYIGQSPNYCRAVAVRFSDGTLWRDRDAGAAQTLHDSPSY